MTKRIAIIGAGCAGLGAARALLESGVDLSVVLIEATDRMGGRAITSTVSALLPVDLGPQFIQDPDINPWKEIAIDLGYSEAELMQPDMNPYYRICEGAVWSDVFMNPGIEAANDALDEQYLNACGYPNMPIMTGNAPAFCDGQRDLRLALGSNKLGAIAESAEPWQYVASDRERQDHVDAGANIYVKDGLGTLVAAFGKDLTDTYQLKLQFASPVVVDGIDDTDPTKVKIHAGDNEAVSVDFCIVTIPCSEIAKIEFKPNLPGAVVRAGGFIQLGSYKKVAFQPAQFPAADGPNPLNEDTDYYIYKAPAREDDDPEKPFLADTGGTWQYFRLPTKPDVLICVASGNFARRLDGLPDNQVSDSVIALLTAAYPGGNFAPQGNEVVITNWTNAPYVHGAYSYTRYDDELGPDNPFPLEARALIAKPHGRVHFAGEATWIPAYGTIQGAYWSGKRAADEILEIIKAGS